MTHVLADATVTTGEAVTFWILAPIIVCAALGMVLARSAVRSALMLATVMLSLGVLYMLQSGPFIGFAQIIVYTGAIMMLFLFVIMLVGRNSKDSLLETLRGQRVAAVFLGLGMAALLCTGLARGLGAVNAVGLEDANNAYGDNVKGIAADLFTKYLFAFEVTSGLLITAAVGAMLLAHIERKPGHKGQKEMSRERFLEGNYPGPKTGPGVFATSDSVATPALLPDGTESERSISPIVPVRDMSPEDLAPKGTDKKK